MPLKKASVVSNTIKHPPCFYPNCMHPFSLLAISSSFYCTLISTNLHTYTHSEPISLEEREGSYYGRRRSILYIFNESSCHECTWCMFLKLFHRFIMFRDCSSECPNYGAIMPVLLKHGVHELPNHCKLTPGNRGWGYECGYIVL